jgi:predicted RNA binding protein YcfA (HicA-like mRNA interferase family)
MKCSEFLKLLKKDGWFTIGQKGSHIKMKHPTKNGIVIFPNHGSSELGKKLKRVIQLIALTSQYLQLVKQSMTFN